MVKPLEWLGTSLKIIDQTKLPGKTVFLDLDDYRDVVTAIKHLKVRGAPAIGVAAAYGIALGAQNIKTRSKIEFRSEIEEIFQNFADARPTAVNLFRAIRRMKQAMGKYESIPLMKDALICEAKNIHTEEESATECLSRLGAELIKDCDTIMTHCNAGPLATAGYGTALGVIIAAKEQGKNVNVISCETRPLLQGARLTTWELMQENIPTTLITDSMAGYFLHQGKVNCVIVGADRIAANGDTANKIGTYSLAVLAFENKVPFYVAAPSSTFDLTISSGDEIPIEERKAEEVTTITGVCVAPQGVRVANPAFDVTPHQYITAIITEKGIVARPFGYRLKKLLTTD
jgi:methylthioribose-1-phosphate isomerase